jgi:hypothetical protein
MSSIKCLLLITAFLQMVHYVSASALISQAKQTPSPTHPDLFGQLLKKAGGMGDIRDCPVSFYLVSFVYLLFIFLPRYKYFGICYRALAVLKYKSGGR